MNLRIFKYPLEIVGRQTVRMPYGASILSVQEQHGALAVWAVVDADAEAYEREFLIVGTGYPLPNSVARVYHDRAAFVRRPAGKEGASYVATVQQMNGALVWHVFAGPYLQHPVQVFGQEEPMIRHGNAEPTE